MGFADYGRPADTSGWTILNPAGTVVATDASPNGWSNTGRIVGAPVSAQIGQNYYAEYRRAFISNDQPGSYFYAYFNVVAGLAGLSLSPASVTGGVSSTGSITLTGPAPTNGTLVTLTSDNAAATVPASVTVAAGATGITFPVTTTAVTSSATANITATYGGVSKSAALTISPASSNTSLSSLTLNLFTLKAGDTCSGAVQINSASSVPVTINLASSDPSVIVPSNVTVSANQTMATFSVTTNTIDPIQATITASYNSTVQSVVLNALPAINLYCVATGSSKVTLYWTGINGVSGYNVYKSVTEAGPYTQVNTSPISSSDPGPGLTNRYMYSDTGLTTGTEYFYYVNSATGTAISNDDSAIPSSDAISWDSGNASLIVSQVRSMATANLTEDEPAVGLLTIAGPDGVIYKGFTDGTPAAAYASPGHYDSNAGTFAYADGNVVPAPLDAVNDNLVGISSSMAQQPMNNAHAANTTCPLQAQHLNKTYAPTVRYGGILREVQAQAGFRGFASLVSLPDQRMTGAGASTFLDGRTGGQSIFPTDDTGYVYTGGTAYQVHHRRGSGASYVDIGEIDAGLELFRTNDPDRPGYIPYASQPGTYHGVFDTEILGDPLADNSASAGAGCFQGPYVYVQGQPLMTFKVAGYGSVPDKTIILSFHAEDNALVITYNRNTQAVNDVNDVTYVDGAERGWTKSACIVIKRMNTIAQTINRAGQPPIYINGPTANGPGLGFFMDGSYILGAAWGVSDAYGLTLLYPGSGYTSWTDDSTITSFAASYPPMNTGYIKSTLHNPYFWETNLNMRTSLGTLPGF